MKCTKLLTASLTIFVSLHLFGDSSLAMRPSPTPAAVGSRITIDIPATTGNLLLSGYTSPNALVTITREGSVAGTVIACPGGPVTVCASNTPNGYFEKLFTGLYPGIYNFGVYASDTRSPSLSTPTVSRTLVILEGLPSISDPMTLPPTINVTKPTIKRPETQSIVGMGRANSNVRVSINGIPNPTDINVDNDGFWNDISHEVLHLGNNYVYSTVQSIAGAISETSKIINFLVEMSADLNIDTEVDILDFSMLMFNYGLTTPPNWAADINDDTFVDLSDFSIMMYNWTGDTGQIIATPTPSPIPTASPSPSPSPTISPSPSASPTP